MVLGGPAPCRAADLPIVRGLNFSFGGLSRGRFKSVCGGFKSFWGLNSKKKIGFSVQNFEIQNFEIFQISNFEFLNIQIQIW